MKQPHFCKIDRHFGISLNILPLHLKIVSIMTLMTVQMLLQSLKVEAQGSYPFFTSTEKIYADSTGSFYFALNNANFFKNNEYSTSPLALGYTLTGSWLRPKLIYYPDKKIRIEFGGDFLKYNGREEYSHVVPWLSILYQPIKSLNVTIGNLSNSGNHDLPEFVFNPEYFLTTKPEAGIELQTNNKAFKGDFWIDWQQLILPGDPYQEKFNFGMKTDWKLMIHDKSTLILPLTFFGMHYGGEIDVAHKPSHTLSTLTGGFVYSLQTECNFIQSYQTKALFSISSYPKDNDVFKQSKGHGFFLESALQSRVGRLAINYWQSQNYWMPLGNPIYQNLNINHTEMLSWNRQLGVNYMYVKEIFPSTYFSGVVQYYYDINRKISLNSEAVYLILNFSAFQKKKGNRIFK